jgi:hypothetical protein
MRAGVDLVQQLLDAILSGDRLVVLERKIGDALEAQARADLPPEEWLCAIERARAVRPRLFVAEYRVEHPRELDIRADLNAGECHKTDTGIVDFSREERSQFATNLISDSIGSGALGHLASIAGLQKKSR